MKKPSQKLNAIFSVAEEMIQGNGEDCFYYDVKKDSFFLASFDGCGGSGSKKYTNYSDKTGAYIASRAVCGGVKDWYNQSGSETELTGFVKKALSVCKQFADAAGRITGSLSKAFPTTAAMILGKPTQKGLSVTCFWAGDSRCYLLDSDGLHQLTQDDLDGQDAMSNLTNDGVMTNVINASTSFEIHCKTITVTQPCILLTATDGCFGYLNSPMEFEHLLVDSLVKAQNPLAWKQDMNNRMHEVTGDDYTLCAAIYGYQDFDSIRKDFVNRARELTEKFIQTQTDVHGLWEIYKPEYSRYLLS